MFSAARVLPPGADASFLLCPVFRDRDFFAGQFFSRRHREHLSSLHHWQEKQSLQLCFLAQPVSSGCHIRPSMFFARTNGIVSAPLSTLRRTPTPTPPGRGSHTFLASTSSPPGRGQGWVPALSSPGPTQLVDPPLQSQVGSEPLSAPIMNAVAQPTPESTLSAETGQFPEHAPHSMHAFRSTIFALPLSSANTPCGQTSRQRPHPTHVSRSNCSDTTFLRYFMFVTLRSEEICHP